MSAGRNIVLGGFVLIVLIGLTYGTFQLVGFSLTPQADWTVYFGRDSWIREGFDVFTSGTRVGVVGEVARVRDEEIEEGRYVRAVLRIDPKLTLFEGARVRLESTGFLGSRAVILDRGDPRGPRLPDGTVLQGVVQGDVVGEMERALRGTSDRLGKVFDEVASIAGRMNRGEGSLGLLLTRTDVYDDLSATARELRTATASLNSPDTAIGILLHDEAFARDVRDGVARLRSIADELERVLIREKAGENASRIARELADGLERLNRGEGTVARLLYDKELGGRVADGLADLAAILRDARAGEGTLGRVLKDPRAFDAAVAAADDLGAILRHVREGKGSVGRLLMDDRVARDLEAMLQAFREGGEVARENAPLATLTSFTTLFFNVLN